MFDAVHAMRTRIITANAFTGDQILGAILFENTMDRQIDGIPTSKYLWEKKQVIPFLKVDKGLADEEDGVQIMKPMPALDDLLKRAKAAGIFGTKMRSNINSANETGIQKVVQQQFAVGKQIIAAGLIPIIEPEVNIQSADKADSEKILKKELLAALDELEDGEEVMLKLSLPSEANFYRELVQHPKCVRVVALSGGYSRDEANDILSKQEGMIASFSRALSEGLAYAQSESEFDGILAKSIDAIYAASAASS